MNIQASSTSKSVMAFPKRATGDKPAVFARDDQGRLWIRMSSAIIASIIGVALLTAPLIAVGWATAVMKANHQTTHLPPPPHVSTTVTNSNDPTHYQKVGR